MLLPGVGVAQGRPPAGGGPLQVDVDQANLRPRPIAVPAFLSEDPQLGQEIAAIVASDLKSSGLFEPLDPRSFIERITDTNAAPRSADWRSIGAEALVVGRVGQAAEGRLKAEFRLWDVVLGKQLTGQQLATASQSWRRLGHIIADQVWEKLTLEKGYFDTRIVFIDETGPKQKRIKRLAIMDQDGANVRMLSNGQELVLTPRFSPTSLEITYMTYTSGEPRVVLMNIETGQRQIVGDFPGMTFAPRFSPDGQRIVMSQGERGVTGLVEMDLRSRQMRRLTDLRSIDTGPCYAPDGRQIVFESDREGTQQLYVISPDGGGVRRISVGEGRYSTPVWSPRGDYIAFTKQVSGRFLIGVMRTDGTGERVITEGYHNEGPTWAPNGRFLMFFREQAGASGGPRLYAIDITGHNERQVRTPSFASDPAWSPLLR
ncbi:MAG: Tol-Pal system beta propeller repeat protein TolB [Hyphomicrobiaceae bacterium]|nr:Tol-Pal system beta propeller repeat protein TolB [Hyphomicrobiaceae bacterium]